jgi:photosystem II stability/assembly factor-like uncharacterized protein
MLRRLIMGGAAALLSMTAVAPLHAQIDPELLAGMKARSVGPAAMSGRIADIEALVSNPDIVYVGTATGGVWKSVNGGLTFDPIFDDQPVHAIGNVAVFQASPDIVWVGTGEGNPRNSVSGTGWGMFKSMDAGRTWEHLGLEATERIHRIALHPSNPDVAYVGAMGSMWKPNPERGVYKTEDGGATWSKILYVNENTGVGDMVMDPTNPSKLIAAMWDYQRWPWFFRSGGPGSGLYMTVDGGRNWKQLTSEDGLPEGELGRIGLAIAPSDPNIVYALIEAEENALYKSVDGGHTWRKTSTDSNIGNRPFYYYDLRVDPQDPNRVYSLYSRVSVSTDGGESFDILIRGGVHSDHHAMWIDPNNPDLIYEGNDGGVYISRDRGASWKFVRNLPLAQYYHINVDMETPYNIIGGFQDNGSWRGPSSVWERGGIRNHHWTRVGGGDGFAVLADPNQTTLGYAMSQQGFLRRWNLENGESRDIRPGHHEGVDLRFNWNAAIAIDPFDGNTVYYGSQFVHKSTDRGLSWEIISPDLSTNNREWQNQLESGGLTYDVTGAENFTSIVAIAPSALERGVIWVGTDDGRVHITRDGGTTWTSLEDKVKGVPKNTWVPHIEPSKFNPSSAYVVFDDHRRGNFESYVYKTSDYGNKWESLAGGDIWGYALVIEQDPVKEDLLFLGTEFGLYVSLDGGDSWFKWTEGLPTASVMALTVHPRDHDLVIGTHGRSAFVIDDIRPLRIMTAEMLAEPLHAFAIPDAIQYQTNQSSGVSSSGQDDFRGENRQYGAMITFSLNAEGLPHPEDAATARGGQGPGQAQPAAQAGAGRGERGERRQQVAVEIRDADGKVIRTLEQPAMLGVNRITWNLALDAFRRPSTGQQQSSFFQPSGPQVLPGRYTVTVKYGDHEASSSVNVLPDPRYDIPQADRIAKYEALMHVGALSEVLTDAVERTRNTRTEIDDVLKFVQKGEEAATATSTNGEGTDGGNANRELMKTGRELKKTLSELEKEFWTPPGTTKGIQRVNNASRRLSYVGGSLGSSRDAPTQAQMVYLEQAESALQSALVEFNRVFSEDVAAFRAQVESAGISFLEPGEPLTLPKR